MAHGELLRVTQPIINRAINVNAHGKPTESPSTPFQVVDASKVQTMSHDKGMDGDNNQLLLDADQPSILSQMLQDPAATVHFLRTIYLLQEIVGMMPLIDNPVSEELEKLFDQLMLKPEDIVGEMIKQEQSSTLFKGELFDNLRNMIEEMAKFDEQNYKQAIGEAQNKGLLSQLLGQKDASSSQTVQNMLNNAVENNEQTANKELLDELQNLSESKNFGITNYEGQIKTEIADLLRNMNGLASRQEILTSIGNNLNYLANALAPHKSLAEQLRNLADWFQHPNQDFDFEKVKSLVNQYTDQISKSVLYNDKIAKNVSILQYNFSRFIDSTEGLEKSVENMFKYFLDEKDMMEFKDMVYKQVIAMSSPEGRESSSQVMRALCQIIEKQVANSTLTNLNGDKIEKIVYSLLSSPTNFTPLLHYIIPVEYMGMQAFAEMWIDPICEGDEENSKQRGGKNLTQVLVAFDVGNLGRFETELMINKNKMSAYVYVPEDYYEVFKDMRGDILKAIADTSYSFDKVEVRPLAAPRSLMEVFKTLPIRRTGINVSV